MTKMAVSGQKRECDTASTIMPNAWSLDATQARGVKAPAVQPARVIFRQRHHHEVRPLAALFRVVQFVDEHFRALQYRASCQRETLYSRRYALRACPGRAAAAGNSAEDFKRGELAVGAIGQAMARTIIPQVAGRRGGEAIIGIRLSPRPDNC